jgi:hypothetical protein
VAKDDAARRNNFATPGFCSLVQYQLSAVTSRGSPGHGSLDFEGDGPEALKIGISLVRLAICTDHAKLAAAERIGWDRV